MNVQNFNVFIAGDYTEFEATPERISGILNNMIQKGLQVMPGTFQEINPGLGLKKFDRMQFFNQKNNFTVSFNVDSIHFFSSVQEKKEYNFDRNLELFISQVKKVLSSIEDYGENFPNGKRVSLITSTFPNRESIRPLVDIYKTFGNTIPNYNPEETFEWTARAVKTSDINIKGIQEKINIVSEISRVKGEFGEIDSREEFETANTVIDINTVDNNKNYRVDKQFAEQFFSLAKDLLITQYKSVREKIDG